jgi:hypothetical protein
LLCVSAFKFADCLTTYDSLQTILHMLTRKAKVVVIVVISILIITLSVLYVVFLPRDPSPERCREIAAALFAFQHQYATNGNRLANPGSLSGTSDDVSWSFVPNGAYVTDNYERFGIRTKKGFLITRTTTNETTWKLTQFHTFSCPSLKRGWTLSEHSLGTFTNAL